MSDGICTHLVLYVRDVSLSKGFYVDSLQAIERRYAEAEGFLSISAGGFIINFYQLKEQPPPFYTKGIAHIGFEFSTRAIVDSYYYRLWKTHTVLYDEAALQSSHTNGPYRFYVLDPDGYVVEIHSWEGIEE